MSDAAPPATLILRRIQQGDRQATEELLPLVYRELRRMAGARMRGERQGVTLTPTELVHEAYLRLVGEEDPGWESRAHFFGAASEAMRRILIDRARRAGRQKRGGGRERVELESGLLAVEPPPAELLALDRALERLQEQDAAMAAVVKLRYFAGLSVPEIAELQSVSERTVFRQWRAARAWLVREVDSA